MITELGIKRLQRIHTIEQLTAKLFFTKDSEEAIKLKKMIALHEEASNLEFMMDDIDRIISEIRSDSGYLTEEEI